MNFVLIVIRVQKFRCFSHSNYFLCFMQYNFILRIINNGIIFLLYVNFLSWYRMIPAVLSRITNSVFRTKVSQDLAFVRIMAGAVDKTYFQFAWRAIYISVYALVRALTHLGVSLWWGVFSSILPDVTIMVKVYLSGFLY